jgi:biopolymer transport protein ExbB/TolQ
MYVILIVFAAACAILIERMKSLAKLDVDGPSFMNELQRYVLSNDIQGAIRVCSGSAAALPKVLKSGLKRANQSPEQIQNAIDATALEVIPKLEQRLPYLSLCANLSTLFGLLGTIQGLIQSFAGLSAADPTQKAEILSAGLAVAMYTTALGLGSAIVIMVFHAVLGAKSEKIVGEIDEYSVKLTDLLLTKKVDD